MKEEDLIKKLESTQLPEVELLGHKSQLKMALLKSGHGDNALEIPTVKRWLTTMKSIFTSKQPVWRTALVGILAMALVVGLLTGLPPDATPASAGLTDEGLALYIAQTSDILIEAAGSEEKAKVSEVFIVYVNAKNAMVQISGTSPSDLAADTTQPSWQVFIKVDLVEERIKLYNFNRDYVNEAEKELIDEVLKADPRTKALLDDGATIYYEGNWGYMWVDGSYLVFEGLGVNAFGRYLVNEDTGERKLEARKHLIIRLELGDVYYEAYLELVEGVVEKFGDPLFSMMSSEEINVIDNILQADAEAKALLDAGAVIKFMASYILQFQVAEEESGDYWQPVLKKVSVIIGLGDDKYEADVEIRYEEGILQGEMMWFAKVGSPEYEANQFPPLPDLHITITPLPPATIPPLEITIN